MSAVAVAGVGLYAAGYPNTAAWLARQPNAPAADQPQGALLDKHSRRRASALTKALADAYREALLEAQLDGASVASVFGLALGEASTMIGLLEQMWKKDGVLSPMRFAASVHNAAAGVVSIGSKNTGLTTSLGADFDTPAMSLYEALAIVKTHGEPVLIACGDEAAPVDLVSGDEGWDSLTCALALVPLERADLRWPRLGVPFRGEPTLAPADMPRGFAQNPQAGMLDLIDAVRRGASGSVRLDRGRGRGYCIEITQPS
jgi:hypothetical protein